MAQQNQPQQLQPQAPQLGKVKITKGREIDLDLVAKCASLGLSQRYIAFLVGVTPSILDSAKVKHKELFALAFAKGRAMGGLSVMTHAWRSIEKGSVAMQMFMINRMLGPTPEAGAAPQGGITDGLNEDAQQAVFPVTIRIVEDPVFLDAVEPLEVKKDG